jgi:hypothetical protein
MHGEDGGAWLHDPGVWKDATETQIKYRDAVIEHRTMRVASRALGVAVSAISEALKRARANAARYGHAPGHFNDGTAPGYRMGKVTIQRGPAGVERVWERQHPDDVALRAAVEAMARSMADDVPRAAPVAPPAAILALLANLYTLTDYHLGMQAWAREGGAHWDITTAKSTMIAALEHMVANAPAAGLAILNIQGDFLHTDGPTPVTPEHAHVLDAAGRYAEMVDAAIEVLRRAVDLLLMFHGEVRIIFAEGNHDPRGAMFLRKMFAALYEREPRVTVNDSELPFYVERFGKVMIGVHHGHKVKNEQLPLLFASQFSEVWGQTTKRYAHCGHRHHRDAKEYSGMIVEQHPTLAARDAYAARGGWIAERAAICITYHREFGEVARATVTPEMLAA